MDTILVHKYTSFVDLKNFHIELHFYMIQDLFLDL